jgi:hypothetical protein
MGSYMEIFEERVLGRVNKTQFSILAIFQPKTKMFPKTLASNISMLEPIQDNDNYKSHA